jgi:peptidyl-dipeptidase Dcp
MEMIGEHQFEFATDSISNPLLEEWTTPFQSPPFAEIEPHHFRSAFDVSLAEHRAEIDRVAVLPDAPTFTNTIEALERSGRRLSRISSVFFNLAGAHTSDALEAIECEMAPVLARHWNTVFLNEALFRRIEALKGRENELALTAEQARVLDRYHTIFRRRGAHLGQPTRRRLAEISERMAVLGTKFAQNVLADEKAYALVLDSEADLAGLPHSLRRDAAQAATERNMPGKHVITLARSSVEPFLQFSSRRDLRETAFKAWIARGEMGGETDNRTILSEIVRLRAERAALLGYDSFAHFRLDDTKAKTPAAGGGRPGGRTGATRPASRRLGACAAASAC